MNFSLYGLTHILWVVVPQDVQSWKERKMERILFSLSAIMAQGKQSLSLSEWKSQIHFRGSIVSGESPYQKGDASCSACPSDKPFCDRNLCCKYQSTPPWPLWNTTIAKSLQSIKYNYVQVSHPFVHYPYTAESGAGRAVAHLSVMGVLMAAIVSLLWSHIAIK